MNKINLIPVLFLVLYSSHAMSQINFQPRLQLSVDDYEFSADNLQSAIDRSNLFDDSLGSDEFFSIDDTLTMLSAGFTVINSKGFFADLYYSKNITEGEQEPVFTAVPSSDFFAETIKVDRYESAFSVGKLVGDWQFSLGYRDGESELSQTHGLDFGVGSSRVFFQNSSSFKLSGPYIVAGYAFDVGRGQLSVKTGLTDLTGDWDLVEEFDNLGTGTITSDLEGGATGLNIGVHLKMPFTEGSNWSWNIGADYYSYDFNVTGESVVTSTTSEGIDLGEDALVNFDQITANVREDLLSIKLGISYFF